MQFDVSMTNRNVLVLALVFGSFSLAACATDLEEDEPIGEVSAAKTKTHVDVICVTGRGYINSSVNNIEGGGPEYGAFCMNCKEVGGSCSSRPTMYGSTKSGGGTGCVLGDPKRPCTGTGTTRTAQ